ncbi:MAG: 2-amino-4-hydroxy-6-hydroxymethyldihydropteridine diphosphokinase [Planctomycetota bacterium]|nr:MAG: 2-amino-4-hydroxy-6-hydroxymethyldihydropteridine diphosphokinase [Planctomycetota bacterium]
MTDIFVALGSNLGDRCAHLRFALDSMAELPGVRLRQTSAFHATAPVGGPSQPTFLNAVARLETHWSPWELLARLQRLEWRRGRRRLAANGPRTLDLDLLHHGCVQARGPWLTLPHPRMESRRFVLAPLAELAPDLPLASGRTVSQSLEALPPA